MSSTKMIREIPVNLPSHQGLEHTLTCSCRDRASEARTPRLPPHLHLSHYLLLLILHLSLHHAPRLPPHFGGRSMKAVEVHEEEDDEAKYMG